MSTSVCYLERAASGAALLRVRLVGVRSDHTWTAPMGERFGGNIRESIAAAARWITQESTQGPTRGDLVLCLDLDGAACGWVTTPSAEEPVIAAAVRAAQTGGADEAQTPPAAWLRNGEIGRDFSVQGLAEHAGEENRRQRIAVLATPDLPVRVLLDELDAMGRSPARVVNLWHAIAGIDRPEEHGGSGNGHAVVASDEPVSAVALIEPSGRLIWTWSSGGRLLCGGTMRLRRSVAAATESGESEAPQGPGSAKRLTDGHPAEVSVIEVTRHDIGRLVAEWLAWGAQLGVAPARLYCAGPASITVGGLDSDLPEVPGIAAVGQSLARSWAGAGVQAVIDEDPLGAVLRRMVEQARDHGAGPEVDDRGIPKLDPHTTLLDLSRRPGRASRKYYVWAAMALLACAVGIAALGYRLNRSAASVRDEAAQSRAARLDLLTKVKDTVKISPDEPDPVRKLRSEQTRLQQFAEKITPEKPVLAEFARVLKAAAAVPGALIKNLTISTVSASGVFVVPDAEVGPRLLTELLNQPAQGPRIAWKGSSASMGAERTYSLSGSNGWRDPDPVRPAPSPPAKSPATAPAEPAAPAPPKGPAKEGAPK